MKHWSGAQLKALRQIRERFLEGTAGAADYWRSLDELALYDETFAERIGWKWDAVLRELQIRSWTPSTRHVLDWGCGSGVAGRRVLSTWPGQFESLTVYDRSTLAMRFAADRAKAAFPEIRMEQGAPASLPANTLLVLSHVLNELPANALENLLRLARQASEIVWVEAGTHADSRRLISDVREQLLGDFHIVAPCTHNARCGMLAPENSRHWCHSFAPVPSEAFQSARWAELSRELRIDLRALPYSFLTLQKAARPPAPPGWSRMIGEPRDYKGFSKVLSSQADGVAEFMLQKRDAPQLLRDVREGRPAPIYRWDLEGDRIVGGETLPDENAE